MTCITDEMRRQTDLLVLPTLLLLLLLLRQLICGSDGIIS